MKTSLSTQKLKNFKSSNYQYSSKESRLYVQFEVIEIPELKSNILCIYEHTNISLEGKTYGGFENLPEIRAALLIVNRERGGDALICLPFFMKECTKEQLCFFPIFKSRASRWV
ncbi:hypothetical protein CEXT_678181 [Caerostris extrusa]|uniref:Uncharacterized protein n=1 Tax=Caerostris extrusa TaxID=172846 RepID=A0AAV4TAN6_CAEEX|nr:hypothetical protein CEXT_678181 [Caerostris extrusa]